MAVNEQRIRKCLRSFDLAGLFKEELGWDRLATPYSVTVDGVAYALTPIAQKRGMVALMCPPQSNGEIPDYKRRGQIEKEVTKSAREHIVIYVDAAKSTQVWQWAKREKGRPIARREHTWKSTQSGDALVQKLRNIAFNLDEEEELSLVMVTGRARAAFDIERVTKRFYDLFKTEHTRFLGFIKGIEAQGDREWYASVMLNRLMFVYFIQKKKFLDGDPDYLRNRLARVQAEKGKGRFHSFYRYFLLRLFHEGLGERERNADLEQLLGKVPYLNGGIFSPHQLEQDQSNQIEIADVAFERVFDFFDKYQWHLDDRPLRNDNEINPDVLGFIFEKYINQKQMGAYYTKEDITEYIGRNTIVPYLFDAAREECRIAFDPQGSVWRLPKDRPDRYLFDAVAMGCDIPLPPEIEAGVIDVAKREGWNQAAPAEYALPTEIWRETVARRQRYAEVRAKLASGEVTSINDFITYNLDLRQLAEDVITESEGPELLRAFWKALTTVRILDPTVGSGAFLFAALNILEPLYEACLNRMEAFIADSEQAETKPAIGALPAAKPYADLRAILKQVSDHRDRRYHIYKSIIINNLYGVDIMEEATEICKLRLFLKLVSVVERVDDIEPLPDIDFNIRAGNTLVGYASREELRRAVQGDDQGKLVFDDDVLKVIEHRAALIDQQFDAFRHAQTNHSEIAVGDLGYQRKQAILHSLDELRYELNQYLSKQYDQSGKSAFTSWKKSHRPFHWFAEFYGVLNDGGFDVIIGNPPYVVYAPVKVGYSIAPLGYLTEATKNLYSIVFERSLGLGQQNARVGLIVQLSVTSSERQLDLQAILAERGKVIISSFTRRPESMFTGVEMPVSIVLSVSSSKPAWITAGVSRLYSEERPNTIDCLQYVKHSSRISCFRIAKIKTHKEFNILQKVTAQPHYLEEYLTSKSTQLLYYQEACRYWVKACRGLPYFSRNGELMPPLHGRILKCADSEALDIVTCLLNSSLFYWHYSVLSDCEHINDQLIRSMRLPALRSYNWKTVSDKLAHSIQENASRKTIYTKQGHIITYDEIKVLHSKPIIDEIDRVLAKHYGFTDEETDFIINYDIKYRMGRGGTDAEEE